MKKKNENFGLNAVQLSQQVRSLKAVRLFGVPDSVDPKVSSQQEEYRGLSSKRSKKREGSQSFPGTFSVQAQLSEKNRHDVKKMIEEWKALLKACKKYRKEKKQEEFEKHVCSAKKKKKDLTVYVQRIPQKRVEIITMLRFMYRSSHSRKRDRDGETIVTSFGVLYGVRGVTRLIASFL